MNTSGSKREQFMLLRWRDQDTPCGVTKRTASIAADQLGMTETQLIHAALAQYIAQRIPNYQADFDDLTQRDLREIKRRVPQRTKGRVISSILIDR